MIHLIASDPIFTAVDLANFAQQLDEEEKATMAEGGLTNPDFIRFMQVTRVTYIYVVAGVHSTINVTRLSIKPCRFKGHLLVSVYKGRGIVCQYTCVSVWKHRSGVICLTSVFLLIFD